MEYTKSAGDYYETFEGTPEEIAELLRLMPIEGDCTCVDQDELIDYIEGQLFIHDIRVPRKAIEMILTSQLKYLKKESNCRRYSRVYLNKYTCSKL